MRSLYFTVDPGLQNKLIGMSSNKKGRGLRLKFIRLDLGDAIGNVALTTPYIYPTAVSILRALMVISTGLSLDTPHLHSEGLQIRLSRLLCDL